MDSSCPMCAEEMDCTDRQFNPCRCGYQMCVFCWHRIMEVASVDNTEGRCPACRSPYDREKVLGTSPSNMDSSCPMCAEEMDYTDRQFNPCRCGYQLCVFCWHRIIEVASVDNTEGRCPACRSPYDREKVLGRSLKRNIVVEGMIAADNRPHVQNSTGRTAYNCRKDLSNVRVVKKNLVHISGLPLSVADEKTLERGDFFGQYGQICKIFISKRTVNCPWPRLSADVFVTFRNVEDASKCIEAVDCYSFEGMLLKAKLGTTKLCKSWLKEKPCYNPDCSFAHDWPPRE